MQSEDLKAINLIIYLGCFIIEKPKLTLDSSESIALISWSDIAGITLISA